MQLKRLQIIALQVPIGPQGILIMLKRGMQHITCFNKLLNVLTEFAGPKVCESTTSLSSIAASEPVHSSLADLEHLGWRLD